ncbi:hypothetical protein ACFL54_09345, partial [Planctomycetota bacterium]
MTGRNDSGESILTHTRLCGGDRRQQDLMRKKVLDVFDQNMDSPTPDTLRPKESIRPVIFVAAVAACALLALGLWFYIGNSEKNAPGESGSGTEVV